MLTSADFARATKARLTDDAELDARDWHKPYAALIAELAQLGLMPATKAVCDRIDAIEADLNGWRDDAIHDLMVAYSSDGDDDAWENAKAEAPCLITVVEQYFEECGE